MTNLFTREANGASGFNSQQMLVLSDVAFSCVSAFSPNRVIEEKDDRYNNKLADFCQLVVSRKKYLDDLPSLSENWISGNSSLPSRTAIEKSKNLLDAFNSNLVQKKQQGIQIDIPKLVIGPIPAGGIEVEFHVNSENAIYVSVLNNDTIEIELKMHDLYLTIEPTDPNRGMIAGYEMLANANGNSG